MNDFQNKVVVITGGANGIGKCIAEEFTKQGAHVCVIDTAEGSHYVGDIADKATLEDFSRTVTQKYGRVGNPLDIANMVLFLASSKAGFITGENICIDGGQTRLMIYHGDHGWTLEA